MKLSLKSSLFKRYIWSYILVFSLPFLLLILVINNIYIRSMNQELSAAKESYLEQIDSILTNNITEMNRVGNLINFSSDFNYLSFNATGSHTELRDRIRIYEQSSRAIEAVYIVFNPIDTVVTSRGSMSVDAMLNHSVHFNMVESATFTEKIAKPQNTLIVQTLDTFTLENAIWSNRTIYYTMPLGGKSNSKGSIIFVMNTEQLQDRMLAVTESEEGMSFLLNENNEVILSSNLYTQISQDAIAEIIPHLDERETVQIDQTKYSVSSVQSELAGWKLVTLIDTNRFYQPLYKVIFFFVVGALILAIMQLVISYYFANKHYKPIKSLTTVFNEELETNTDEWGFLEKNINKTYSEIQTLNRLVNEHTPIIQNAAILDLIEGRFEDEKEMERYLREIDITFPYPLFSLLIIELGDQNLEEATILTLEKLRQGLNKKQVESNFNLMAAVPHLRNNQIFMLVNSEATIDKQWRSIYAQLESFVFDKELLSNWQVKVGVGNSYASWGKIRKSFIEASSALEVINLKNSDKNQILFFDDIIQNNKQDQLPMEFSYPQEEVMLLIQSLKQGNAQVAKEIIGDIYDLISRDTEVNIATQAIVAYLFNAVIQTANDIKVTVSNHTLNKLRNFADIPKTRGILLEICECICLEVQERLLTESTEIEKKVVQIIFENYDSPDISLEKIASEYNISISYASKLVKEETGESFSNILQNLRMNRFKELLIETNDPIKELVLEIGYFDVSNFTRKFRQENGVTPGQFRKKYRTQLD